MHCCQESVHRPWSRLLQTPEVLKSLPCYNIFWGEDYLNLEQYLENKKQREQQTAGSQYRGLCTQCMQPHFGCYCAHIQPFDPKIKFVVLIHPVEVKRRIATGRMSHLCLKNSELIMGQDYTNNDQLNSLLQNPHYSPVVLYPGVHSVDISVATEKQKTDIFEAQKRPMVIVIDGTWPTARKMIHKSKNLTHLPRICFNPPGPSRFRVRKQPKAYCYSTIEAIHHTIELLGPSVGFDLLPGEHDALLNVFDVMVENQLGLMRTAFENPKPNAYRKLSFKVS